MYENVLVAQEAQCWATGEFFIRVTVWREKGNKSNLHFSDAKLRNQLRPNVRLNYPSTFFSECSHYDKQGKSKDQGEFVDFCEQKTEISVICISEMQSYAVSNVGKWTKFSFHFPSRNALSSKCGKLRLGKGTDQ